MMMKWIIDFIRLVIPNACRACGAVLMADESYLCLHCLLGIPHDPLSWREGAHLPEGLQEIDVERVTSLLCYDKKNNYNRLIYEVKYHGGKELGRYLGRLAAEKYVSPEFFEGIDVIVPVPLHRSREKKRGYNQCEWIARGISDVTGIPVDCTSVVRTVNTDTQTRKNRFERHENVIGIFYTRYPERLSHKHVLIIDDVLTSGATLAACGLAICKQCDVKLSLFTLARAGD